MNIPLIIAIVYVVITTAITVYFSNKNNATSQFFIANSSLGTFMVAALLFASLIGGSSTLGAAQIAFNRGISAVATTWGQALGCLVCFFCLGNFYRAMSKKRGVMSVPEGFRFLFDRPTHTVVSFAMIVACGLIYATTPKAIGTIFAAMTGANVTLATWIAGAILVVMTLTGGLKGIAFMNVINMMIMFLGMLVICVKSVGMSGGMAAMQAAVSPEYFNLMNPSVELITSTMLSGVFCGCISNLFVGGILGADSHKSAKWGAIIAFCCWIPFALFPAFTGIAAKVVMPDTPAASAMYTISNQMGPLYGGLASVIVISACFSTGCTFLVNIATMVTRDIYVQLQPGTTDHQQLIFGKVMTAILGVIFIYTGVVGGPILGIINDAMVIQLQCALVLLLSLAWPRLTRQGAFWGTLVGTVGGIVWYLLDHPFGISGFWPCGAATILIAVLVTHITSKPGEINPGYLEYVKIRNEYKAEEAQTVSAANN